MATSNEEMLLNSKALLWATREVKHLHGVLRLQQPPTCSHVKMSGKLQAFLLKPPATRLHRVRLNIQLAQAPCLTVARSKYLGKTGQTTSDHTNSRVCHKSEGGEFKTQALSVPRFSSILWIFLSWICFGTFLKLSVF